ncbi:unnamed protein product [Didymodactylos carnosus]|uniref:EF-hand domain-containing protein n=2 Tax=Didymodactylos carnosus TaxID=1234261 RepID=A0A816DMK3_9BILA|nr:unnamed protein product [Didymodactylos carnosus]CAF4538971.1 unnamed protein product [Didymodactylos carnosus]
MGNSHDNKSHPKKIKRPKPLNDSQIKEIAQLTGFTSDQVKQLRAGFLNFYPTNGHADKFCEYVFNTFDSDGSGKVDFIEFLLATSLITQKDPVKKLEWAFTMYDRDKSGSISRKEMKKIMDSIFDLLGEDKNGTEHSVAATVDQIYSKMDINGDNKLSKEEFVNGCLADDYLRRLLAPGSN